MNKENSIKIWKRACFYLQEQINVLVGGWVGR